MTRPAVLNRGRAARSWPGAEPFGSPRGGAVRQGSARIWARMLTRRDEDGRVTPFVVVAVTGLLLVAGLVLDGGTALAARSRAIGIAEEAARAGCQQLDLVGFRAGQPLSLDLAAAEQAARTYLDVAGVTGTVTATGGEVTVTATLTTRSQLLGVLGIGEFTVTGLGAARPTPPT